MNKYLSRLSPLERRFVVVVAVVIFIVLNFIFIRPHFGDRLKFKVRLDKAHRTLDMFQKEISQLKVYESRIKSIEGEGATVPEEDQATDLLRTITSEAAMSGVSVISNSRQPPRTNDQFYVEQAQAINVQSGEKELVEFLYRLGTGNSLIRVRDLSLRPDPPRQRLNANVKLVASFQKKTATRATAAAAATPTTTTPKTTNAPKTTNVPKIKPKPNPPSPFKTVTPKK